MSNYFKVFYVGLVSLVLSISTYAVEALDKSEGEIKPSQLIYKLLTLKAECLGEDLHQEIEKIKDQVYSKVTEKDIKEFVQNYEGILTDEQLMYPEKLKCIIYFDKDNKVDSRTLLIGAAYYPKELYLLPFHKVHRINYVNEQLGYSVKYNHPHALYHLGFSAEEYEVDLPEIFPKYHPFETTNNLQVEFVETYLPVQKFNFDVRYNNEEGSIDERKAFFLKLTSQEEQ